MKNTQVIDCRSEEGITIGLIDSLISISRVLSPVLKDIPRTENINEALRDLMGDSDLKYILNQG